MKDLFKRFIIDMLSPIFLSLIIIPFLTSKANAQFFNGPESVTYDTLNSRYLISNVGNGDIVQISDAGDTTFFDRSLARTLGMIVMDNILYVADISGVVMFDLTTDQKIGTVPIPGMVELNDITADTSGYLYITDSSGDRIYRMKISDHSYITIVNGVHIPNGILFDARNNRVLFCQFIFNAPIKQINLDDFSVTTVISTSLSYFDGLAIDSSGNIYVSCWGNNAIYRYDNAFSLPAELISGGHNGPADIYCNQTDNILAIPNYYSNLVDFITITPVHVDETYRRSASVFSLWQNYPNPFNPSTKIKYSVPELSDITIKIYDILGREIETLVNEEKPAGTYEINWYATSAAGGLSSGVYFYQLKAGSYLQTKKMTLLR